MEPGIEGGPVGERLLTASVHPAVLTQELLFQPRHVSLLDICASDALSISNTMFKQIRSDGRMNGWMDEWMTVPIP